MFIYEITENDRRLLMEALEWTEWALGLSMQIAKDEDAEPHVIDNLATEKAHCGYLWDRINQMRATREEFDRMDEIALECDALFRKGQ